MTTKINFFGLNLDILTMEETLDKIAGFIERREHIQHVSVNVAKLVYAQKNKELKDIINSCGLVGVDGAGIILGAKFLGINIPERVTGFDLMENLIERGAKVGHKLYFLGAKEEVVQLAVEYYKEKYPELIVAGYHNGYYADEEEVAKVIKDSKADILFVAMSSPKKEIFLSKYSKQMEIPFVMGVGGSFDFAAGKVKRAPGWMQACGSEWVFRLIQEPGRMWKRYFVTNSVFAFMLLREKVWTKR